MISSLQIFLCFFACDMMKYTSAAVSADQHIFSASTFLCRDWQWCVYAQSAKIGLTNGHGSFGRWLYLRNRLVSRFLPVISWLGSEDPPRSLKLASSALSNTSVGYGWGGAVPWEPWAKSLSRFSNLLLQPVLLMLVVMVNPVQLLRMTSWALSLRNYRVSGW